MHLEVFSNFFYTYYFYMTWNVPLSLIKLLLQETVLILLKFCIKYTSFKVHYLGCAFKFSELFVEMSK